MIEKKSGIHKAIEELLEEQKAAGETPPSVDDIMALRDGVLSPEDEGRIRKNLVLDGSRMDLLLDLERFPEVTGNHPELEEDEDEAWAEMKARIQSLEEDEAPIPFPKSRKKGLTGWFPFMLGAACLIFSLVVVRQAVRLDALSAPTTNVKVHRIHLDGTSRAGAQTASGDYRKMTWEFMLDPENSRFLHYQISLHDLDREKELFQAVEDGPREMLFLTLERDWLPGPGRFYIQIDGLREGQKIKIGGLTFTMGEDLVW